MHSRKFVAFGTLDDAVKDQNIAVSFRLEDEDILIERFLNVENLVDLQGHGLARPLRGDLAEPAILNE